MKDVTETVRAGEPVVPGDTLDGSLANDPSVPVKMNGNSTHDDTAARASSNGTHDNIPSKQNRQDICNTTTDPKISNGHHHDIAPKQNGSSDNSALHVVDSRTGLEYDIPIKNNAVQAVDFKRIKATEKEGVTNPYDNLHNGLRILDSGFENTAVKESKITFVYVQVPIYSLLVFR